jgi:glycosyltransferase involved in cell wall biosynthesis
MKICIFSPFYPIIKGGAEYQAKIIAGYLLQYDEVFYISYGHPDEKIIFEDKIKIYCLKKTDKSDLYTFYYYSASKINRILRAESPHIIYQRVLNSYSYHLSLYAAHTKIPLFIHIADNYCLHFDLTTRSIIRRLFFFIIHWYYIKTRFINFIVQTDEQLRLLEMRSIIPVLKIYNMHPIIANIYYKNILDYKALKIVWIGSAREVKRLELFINLAKDNSEEKSLVFVIIGRLEDSEYGKSLKEMIDRLENIVYLGERANDFINDYLGDCFALINTSISEGFSNTFIQAWLKGVPVISLNADPDGIIERYNLGFCCAGNIHKIKYYLYKIINDSKLYLKISYNCFLYAVNNFSIETNMKLLRNVLIRGYNNV